MCILAIDTATSYLGVAVLCENAVLAEKIVKIERHHSIYLIPLIKGVLEQLKIPTNNLTLIVVNQGPGSYTGVRIGVTTAKTLAWSLNIPLVGVSGLQVLANCGLFFTGLIVPLIDARKKRVYTGLYQKNGTIIKDVIPDQVIPLADWLKTIEEYVGNGQVLFVGDYLSFSSEIKEKFLEQAVFCPESFNLPHPGILGMLGDYYREEKVVDVYSFQPSYLQMAEAEAKLLAKK